MADTVGWNLADIETGLVDSPRYVSEHLQWLTEEGMQDYFMMSYWTTNFFQCGAVVYILASQIFGLISYSS